MKKYNSQEIKGFVSKANFNEDVLLKKDPSWPKISIVTPSYNQAQFIERTILSVLNQNYPNLEYIIIDGGSTDGSVNIIKKYERYLAYWVSEPDEGQSDAINKGFLKSTGEILAWLNSDDTYLPDILIKVEKLFSALPHVDILYGDTYIIDKHDSVLRTLKEVKFSKGALRYWAINLLQPNAFWRKDIFLKVGMLRNKFDYMMDVDLWLRMLQCNAQFKHIPEYLACFRLHSSSKTVSKSEFFSNESELFKKEIMASGNNEFISSALYQYYQLRRFLLFIAQGDFSYVASGIIKRLRIIFNVIFKPIE